METSDETKQKLWDELMNIEKHQNDRLLPEERTILMLMKEYNKSEDQIRRLVTKLERMNLISKRSIKLNGHSCRAYTILEHNHNHEP